MSVFTEERYLDPPKNLQETVQYDWTVGNLRSWAKRLEVFGIILAIILAVEGLIEAIVIGKAAADATAPSFLRGKVFSFQTFISTFSVRALYAFLAYCGFHAVSLILSAYARITYYTGVTARAVLKTLPKDEGDTTPIKNNTTPIKPISTPSGWKCPDCGRENPSYTGTCACGRIRPHADK